MQSAFKAVNDIKIFADSRTNLTEDHVTDRDHREATEDPSDKDDRSDVEDEDEVEDHDERDQQTLQMLRSTASLADLDDEWEDFEDTPGRSSRAPSNTRRSSSSVPQASRSTPQTTTQTASKKATNKKREPFKDELRDLNKMTLVTAQLEYQKAQMKKEVALKSLELKMKRQEQAFQLKMAKIQERRSRKSTRSDRSGTSSDDSSDSSIASVDTDDYTTSVMVPSTLAKNFLMLFESGLLSHSLKVAPGEINIDAPIILLCIIIFVNLVPGIALHVKNIIVVLTMIASIPKVRVKDLDVVQNGNRHHAL
ncbi:hypothetical protein BGZ73_007639 [Actinomortierella ambigua]|nr:hypothetical protein BGZ73_007639 [Actinomortierella ambigua]